VARQAVHAPLLPDQTGSPFQTKVHTRSAILCGDFVFVREDLNARVSRVDVNTATRASDHQPILLELC
jgi:endonuclease/exonuclease/phosphatase family metal-dependent hydrolase